MHTEDFIYTLAHNRPLCCLFFMHYFSDIYKLYQFSFKVHGYLSLPLASNEIESVNYVHKLHSDCFQSHQANIHEPIKVSLQIRQETCLQTQKRSWKVKWKCLQLNLFHSVLVLCQILFKFPSLSLC